MTVSSAASIVTKLNELEAHRKAAGSLLAKNDEIKDLRANLDYMLVHQRAPLHPLALVHR